MLAAILAHDPRATRKTEVALHKYRECNMNNPLSDGLVALHLAAREDHVDVVVMLLKRGHCDVNCANELGDTALHHLIKHASTHPDAPLINPLNALAQLGIDLTRANDAGDSAYALAERAGLVDAVAVLQKHGVSGATMTPGLTSPRSGKLATPPGTPTTQPAGSPARPKPGTPTRPISAVKTEEEGAPTTTVTPPPATTQAPAPPLRLRGGDGAPPRKPGFGLSWCGMCGVVAVLVMSLILQPIARACARPPRPSDPEVAELMDKFEEAVGDLDGIEIDSR